MSELTTSAVLRDARSACYDLLGWRSAPAELDRVLPSWAVPPGYGWSHAPGVASAVLAGAGDRDAAAVAFCGWARSYGRLVADTAAPGRAAVCAGIWQLGAHLAAVAVEGAVRALGDATLQDLVAAAVAARWPGWGLVQAPDLADLGAGAVLYRHVNNAGAARARRVPGLAELATCGIKTGPELPAAQHRLMYRMLQHPDRLCAAATGLPLAVGA